MINFSGCGILLDVEGTTSSISYVYDILFPYARERFLPYLSHNFDSVPVQKALQLVVEDAGWDRDRWDQSSIDGRAEFLQAAVSYLNQLMDGDVKATCLKEVQGLIWQEGYRNGRLKSHLFPDVAPSLLSWHGRGRKIHIFSSGSVAAQKVFFAYTEAGDLSACFSGYHDTTVGPKRDPGSYRKIATAMNLACAELLFLSDVAEELDAASTAGMAVLLVKRPGNKEIAECHHPVITSFTQILIPE